MDTSKRPCAGITRKGSRCPFYALDGRDHCRNHEPSLQALHRLNGAKRKGEPGLWTPTDVAKKLQALATKLEKGRVDLPRASARVRVLTAFLTALAAMEKSGLPKGSSGESDPPKQAASSGDDFA